MSTVAAEPAESALIPKRVSQPPTAQAESVQLLCAAASCTDTVKNGSETDVDCGGSTCKPCAINLALQ